ncbi:MAG: hypothetical protein HY699_19045 [Deltaproteobacteria bacterium]|nr:hypothetical protein [Deltaproteobacteria bacterium]
MRTLPHLTPHTLLIAVLLLAACTPPVRQFELRDQALSCEEANRCAHDTLKAMGYTITAFSPAAAGGQGFIKGARDDGAKSVTVALSCAATGPTIAASEDGKLLGQLDFKRGFYLAFTGLVSQRQAHAAVAQQQAALPLAKRKQQGFEVLITPMPGYESRMEFAADFGAAGVLPIRVVINNRSERRYQLEPQEIVMVRADNQRVHPLSVAAVMERLRQAAAAMVPGQPGSDLAALPPQIEAKLLTTTEMGRDSSAQGYLFYPADHYTRARVLVTEAESEETEGFLVEF